MKTRSGFVSNSSSSSFIIAVPTNTPTCECCKRSDEWLLQAIFTYIATLRPDGNELYKMSSQADVEEYFKAELEELKGSKTYAEEQLATIIELQKDSQLFDNYEKLKKQLERERQKMKVSREAQIFGEEQFQDTLQERRERLEEHLRTYDTKTKEIKELIERMKNYSGEDFNVYAFTIDNWASKAEEALKRLIKDRKVEVIWEEHT